MHTLSNGQTSTGVVVGNGDGMIVLSGGTAIGTRLSYGGAVVVSSGGRTSNSVLSVGGDEGVRAGGLAIQTTISSGGWQQVFGTASGPTISGGFEAVSDGGRDVGALVVNSGIEFVDS